MAAFELLLSQARRHCNRFPPSQISLLFRFSSSLQPCHADDLGSSIFPLLSYKPSIFYRSTSTYRSSFLGYHRSFCSSSSSESPSDTRTDENVKSPTQSATIKAVSYAVKPKDPSSTAEELPQQPQAPFPRRQRETGRVAFRSPENVSEQGTTTLEPRNWTREDIRYVKDIPSISPVSYPSRVAPLPEDRVTVSSEEAPKEEITKEEDKKESEELEQERKRIEADVRLRRFFRVEEEKVPFPTLIKVEKKKQKVVLDLQEAIREVKASAKRNFVETIEAHVKLSVDPRRGDQMVRGAATLPHGTGKTVRVAVFAEGTAADEARDAGADIIGGDELIEEIRKGKA
uniref:50S ribosomal protein L1, chloroplastic n=1 Tax=Nelumbo nucifera TaxID=4432 RepID=A0A823A094_NELNU|nr:TPA_asm: hypothetical protein HUJ06_017535 [Nelumbo nucifera]